MLKELYMKTGERARTAGNHLSSALGLTAVSGGLLSKRKNSTQIHGRSAKKARKVSK